VVINSDEGVLVAEVQAHISAIYHWQGVPFESAMSTTEDSGSGSCYPMASKWSSLKMPSLQLRPMPRQYQRHPRSLSHVRFRGLSYKLTHFVACHFLALGVIECFGVMTTPRTVLIEYIFNAFILYDVWGKSSRWKRLVVEGYPGMDISVFLRSPAQMQSGHVGEPERSGRWALQETCSSSPILSRARLHSPRDLPWRCGHRVQRHEQRGYPRAGRPARRLTIAGKVHAEAGSSTWV
jgi:hypothetical protein